VGNKIDMEKQLIYTIDGINYLLFELPVTASTDQKKYQATALKYNGIMQGVKELKPAGLFSSGYGILNVLIPEQHAVKFSNEV
jgi:hypothetical protein